MSANALDEIGSESVDRLRDLARRCRELAEMTMVPDVARELLSIAAALDSEAERGSRR
jgi:hypothetical protein